MNKYIFSSHTRSKIILLIVPTNYKAVFSNKTGAFIMHILDDVVLSVTVDMRIKSLANCGKNKMVYVRQQYPFMNYWTKQNNICACVRFINRFELDRLLVSKLYIRVKGLNLVSNIYRLNACHMMFAVD